MASTGLTKTFSTSGNQRTITFSAWFKIGNLGTTKHLFSNNSADSINLETNNTLSIQLAGSAEGYLYTNRVFRDISAWYHIVFSMDTTQATASNRLKIYINGVQETSFSATSYPTQNLQTSFSENLQHSVGSRSANNDRFWDGSMAHVHFIDGTAYDASAFGETDSTTGIWKPKTAPSVTYGTNGFFLKFENSGAFGTDSSGNANNFTVNGTMTQTIDTPSNVFATFNPLDTRPDRINTFSNGNTTYSTNAIGRSTLAVTSGKWYAETKYTVNEAFNGVSSMVPYLSNNTRYVSLYGENNGEIFVNGSSTDTNVGAGTAIADGSIIMIAMDLDNDRIYYGKNGLWWTSGSGFVSNTLDSYKSLTRDVGEFYGFLSGSGSGTSATSWNFGNGYFGTTAVSSAQNPDDGIGIFEYDVPTGYRALCTKSINAEEYS